MIQRIQSIFLLLAALALGLLFIEAFDFAGISGAPESNEIMSDGDYDAYDFPLLSGLIGLGIAILLIAIFLFKNRKLQTTITKLGLAVLFAIIGYAAFQYGSIETLAKNMNATISLSYGWASPGAAILLTLMALRGIAKDEKLVKSMDRLR